MNTCRVSDCVTKVVDLSTLIVGLGLNADITSKSVGISQEYHRLLNEGIAVGVILRTTDPRLHCALNPIKNLSNTAPFVLELVTTWRPSHRTRTVCHCHCKLYSFNGSDVA